MSFTSFDFIAFFAATFVLYYLPLSRRYQVELLIVASLFVYWLEAGGFLVLLLASSLSTALLSYLLTDGRARHRVAAFGVAGNLAVLGFFKYKALFLPAAAGSPPQDLLHQLLDAGLPVGISFYTFHGISLIVDTFRDPAPLIGATGRLWSRHIAKTLLYMSFFPQLVAGPIAKGRFLLPQIGPKRVADIAWQPALECLIHGYFLKSVLADNLQQFTAPMTTPSAWSVDSAYHLTAMMLGYSAQIYADFAGYSLIAIGLAKLLGYELPPNFNNPYLASSFAEFWRRWHMSLSSWLRDYLYIPLGGNRHGALRTYANLFIVMALGGLWHGAAWKFAVWGIWHGLALMAERALADRMPAAPALAPVLKILGIPLVFTYVTLGWLLFKLDSFADVLLYLGRLLEFPAGAGGNNVVDANVMLVLTAMTLLYQIATEALARAPRRARFAGAKPAVLGLMLVFILFGSGDKNAFIYFQF
jgi:alginate O-acetyltransferase complex protein AlgI